MPSLEVELEILKVEEPAYYRRFAQNYDCFTGTCKLVDHYGDQDLLVLYEQALAAGQLGKDPPPKALCQLKLTEEQFEILDAQMRNHWDPYTLEVDYQILQYAECWKVHESNVENWEAVTELDQKEYNAVLRVLGVEQAYEASEAEETDDDGEGQADDTALLPAPRDLSEAMKTDYSDSEALVGEDYDFDDLSAAACALRDEDDDE